MTTFKVMTWNLENLFRPGGESGPENQAEYTQKLNSLADVIRELDPDVLAAQEVGDPEAFSDLAEQLEGRYLHSQLSNYPDGRGIRVGFLSKLPIEESEDIVEFPQAGLPSVPGIERGNLVAVTRPSRGALRILVEPKPDFPVHLITAH